MALSKPEIVFRKPKPVFLDMPLHVKEKIANFTDAHTQLSLNRVCKEFKVLVDNAETHYPALVITFHENEITLELCFDTININWISFEQVGTTCTVHTNDRTFEQVGNTFVMRTNVRNSFEKENTNASEKAAELAMKYILNPKRSFDSLMINDDDNLGESFYEVLRERLTHVEHLLHVEEISGSPVPFKHLLPVLKPRVLQLVDFRGYFNTISLRSLTSLEQWKQVNSIDIDCSTDLTLEHLIHAQTVNLAVESITRSHFETMVESCRGKPAKNIRVKSYMRPHTWITRHLQQFECSKRKNRVYYDLPGIKIVTRFSGIVKTLIVEGKSM